MSKLGSKRRSTGVARAALIAASMAAPWVSLTATTTASADVVREGSWPAADPKVSLSLGRIARGEALQKLATAAGWSIVFAQDDDMANAIVVDLADVPATTVLDAVLMGSDWTAKREGNLVRVERRSSGQPRDGAAVPPGPGMPEVPAAPAVPGLSKPSPAGIATPPSPPSRARDLVVTGESVHIAAGDTVHDVTVMGGSADVEGHVTGDLAVIGGSAHVFAGAHVEGDTSAVGGSITIDEGARIDGDVSVVGGIVTGADNAKGRGVKVIGGGDDSENRNEGLAARASRAVSSAVSSAALLFVLGAMLIALAGERFDQLRGEIAARPMRSLAMGIVGMLGSLLTVIVLCVTVIGIPFAAIGVVLFVFAIFAGTAAAATTAGAAVGGHRVKSPYGHLAIGCAIYLVAGLLPWIGAWIQLAILVAGFGAVVATRAAGLIKKRGRSLPEAATPYR